MKIQDFQSNILFGFWMWKKLSLACGGIIIQNFNLF